MRAARVPRSEGFSLIEVMVALIVLSVGLLGIARMQSLALSSTNIANKRSIASVLAASLASAMHENRGYWTAGDPSGATINLAGTTWTFTAGAAVLAAAGSPDCSSAGAPCTPVKIAAYDLNQWSTSLQAALPSDSATLICGTVTPISCLVTIRWSENVVGVNAQSAAQATANATGNVTAAMQVPDYSLYIQP